MLSRKQLELLRTAKLTGRNRLTLAMELADVTQVQVADALQITQSYLSRLATGRYTDIPLEKTRAIAEFFGCTIEDIFPSHEEVRA